MDKAALLTRHDLELRQRPLEVPGYRSEWDATVFRLTGPTPSSDDNAVIYARLNDVQADAAIARQIAHFGGLGHAFEWKLYDHDLPPDLAARLARAGFQPGPTETFVCSPLDQVEPALPTKGVEIRRLDDPAAFAAITQVTGPVHGDPARAQGLVDGLVAEKRAHPERLSVYLAFADAAPVSAGWLRMPPDAMFASLWGGATLPAWRGRGIYHALVTMRAAEARVRGYQYLTVDASAQSRPILERMGFEALATTTPWIWKPQA